jgi:hypothetical protein
MREIPINPGFVAAEGLVQGPGIRRLLHRQVVGGAIIHVDHRQFGEFQSVFGSIMAAMIEHITAIGLCATFFTKGAIQGRNFRRRAREIGRQREITTVCKIEGFRELPGVCFFVEVAIPAEIPEGHAST